MVGKTDSRDRRRDEIQNKVEGKTVYRLVCSSSRRWSAARPATTTPMLTQSQASLRRNCGRYVGLTWSQRPGQTRSRRQDSGELMDLAGLLQYATGACSTKRTVASAGADALLSGDIAGLRRDPPGRQGIVKITFGVWRAERADRQALRATRVAQRPLQRRRRLTTIRCQPALATEPAGCAAARLAAIGFRAPTLTFTSRDAGQPGWFTTGHRASRTWRSILR